jgi:hypothetical protein
MEEFKKLSDTKTFKFEVLISFWLSIHFERIDIAMYLHGLDPLLEKILTNLRRRGS